MAQEEARNNVLLNLLEHQRPDVDKMYLYVKDRFESKYQLFINGRENVGIEELQHSKTLFKNIDYS